MEQVHGIDVSWLHHNQREHDKLKRPSSKNTPSSSATSTPPKTPLQSAQDAPAPTINGNPQAARQMTPPPPTHTPKKSQTPPPQPLPQPALVQQSQAPQQQQQQQSTPQPSKRRSLLRKSSADKLGASPEDKPSKRPSWMSSLSSKFSSSSSASHTPTLASTHQHDASPAPTPAAPAAVQPMAPSTIPEEDADRDHSLGTSPGKSGSSFLSSAFRKFTPGMPQAGPKMATTGTIAPRQVLNIDKGRERCKVKELDATRLKRVAFSVDVEIAGASYYSDDEETPDQPVDQATKEKDKKMMAQSEGAALKNPEEAAQIKEEVAPDSQKKLMTAHDKLMVPQVKERHDSFNSSDSWDDDTDWDLSLFSTATRRPSDDAHLDAEDKANRKAMKEERRRRKLAAAMSNQPISPVSSNGLETSPTIPLVQNPPPKAPERPTTDPVRMYRRCCQLREAPVLKRISEQLSNPEQCGLEVEGNIVGCLDLRGSRMQLPDIMCLSDWLAIVPVRKLLLDNANLTNEGLKAILGGLLAAKTPQPVHRRRTRTSQDRQSDASVKSPQRSHGYIERLSLRNNPKITRDGWRDLCTFISMSKSLMALDVSIIPFPASPPPAVAAESSAGSDSSSKQTADIGELIYKALAVRDCRGSTTLEELIMGDCNLQTHHVRRIVDGAIKCQVRRLGLARNNLTQEALEAVADWIRYGNCFGLDIGGNDLSQAMPILVDAMKVPKSQLWALSIARCNLTPNSLLPLLPVLATLSNFRFLDLSHNKTLFSSQQNAVGILRKYLPRLKWVRRLHLTDVGMSTEQAITLAEVLPEMRNINHVDLKNNAELKVLANATDLKMQEDACALYGSLMVASNVSKTLIAIDLEVPGPDSSEIVKALNKQMLAYCLRNMDRVMATNAMSQEDPASVIPDDVGPGKDVELPDILVDLVAPTQDDKTPIYDTDAHPNQDYIVGSTGLVKALSYVLGQQAADARRPDTGAQSPVTPSTATFKDTPFGPTKAKDMSRTLLANARRIRARLQPSLTKESKESNDIQYRRLQFLDHTLEGMIERFEAEFPECRLSSEKRMSMAIPATTSFPLDKNHERDEEEVDDPSTTSPYYDAEPSWPPKSMSPENEGSLGNLSASRRASETSLASRVLAQEEGRMHRFGQSMRREVLPPHDMDDYLHGTKRGEAPEAEDLAALRSRLETISGDEIRSKVVRQGLEATVREFSDEREEIRRHQQSPGGSKSRPVTAG